jgi:hypothetical protein
LFSHWQFNAATIFPPTLNWPKLAFACCRMTRKHPSSAGSGKKMPVIIRLNQAVRPESESKGKTFAGILSGFEFTR